VPLSLAEIVRVLDMLAEGRNKRLTLVQTT
jgi:hypothetical protein